MQTSPGRFALPLLAIRAVRWQAIWLVLSLVFTVTLPSHRHCLRQWCREMHVKMMAWMGVEVKSTLRAVECTVGVQEHKFHSLRDTKLLNLKPKRFYRPPCEKVFKIGLNSPTAAHSLRYLRLTMTFFSKGDDRWRREGYCIPVGLSSQYV